MTIKEIKVFSDGEDYFKIIITHDDKYISCSYDYEVDYNGDYVLCLYTNTAKDHLEDGWLVRVFLGVFLCNYDIGVHSDKYSTAVTLHGKRSSCSVDVPIEMYSFEK